VEKRSFTRQALHHQGHLSSPQQSPIPCIIKDFCKTGLFIAFHDDHPEQHQPLNVDDSLFVDFKSSGILQLNYRLHVRVARIMNGAIGVQITHNNPEAIHALYKLAKEPAVKAEPVAHHDYAELKEKCRELVEAFANSTDKVLFQAIDEELQDRADHAKDNKQSSAFIDTASRFKKYQNRIAESFKYTLRQEVDNWLSGQPVSLPESMPSETPTALSLVEKDDFEDWLLVKVVVNRADQHYKETLYDLQLRMTELTGTEVNQKNNPLNPTYISHAFYRAITPLALPRKMMQAVLRAFEAQVIVKGLKRLYATLNDLFIKNDVLPVITYQAVKSESPDSVIDTQQASNVETEQPYSPDAGPGSASAPIMAPGIPEQAQHPAKPAQISSTQTLSAVHNLLSLQQASDVMTTAGNQQNLPPIATEQLLSQLTQLQSRSKDQADSETEITADQPLRLRLADCLGAEQTLSEHDNTAVDVTDKFFSSMDNNRHLSDTIKPVFKQLEIPLLKIFIQDESFFEDANHPARQVLNRLAKLGYNGGQLSPQNEQKVTQAIENISQNFDQDTSVFNSAVNELDELIIKQEAITQRNTERLVKSCDGLETIEKGKYTIRRFIELQLTGKQVPKVLIDLINQGWRELLVFTLLRDGQESAIWKSYANVVKSLALTTPESDLGALHQQGTGLLKIIAIGIKEAPGGQAQMNKLMPTLQNLFNPEENPPAQKFVNADEFLSTPDDAFCYIDDEAVQSQALSRWVRRARNLRVGTWVEYGEGEKATQMHLAWIGQDHHKFVFVNHQGMKVVELSLREMAEHLQSGHAKLIDAPDEPFVDQNLDAMVQDMYDQMSYQASHDELTGLINRKQFERELNHTLAQAKRYQTHHAVCHLDLDQFKVINNACGHDAGDTLLAEISKLLTACVQSPNIVARIAGDEFLFILKDTDTQSARNFAAEIKESVQEHRFKWDNKVYTVGASIGIVAVDEATENTATIINAADSARLSAKEAGGNKVHIYQPNDKEQAVRAEVMNNIARLNKALDEERLKLRCQKIMPASNVNEKPHYEILLSIEDELGILLAPGEFIQAAERYNRMQAIDRWVIHNVFTWAMENSKQLAQVDCLTINLSGHSLNDETLMDFILDELLATNIARDKICFEVTETAAVINLTDATEVVAELKELGFKFALDDFGTGQSSYTYLKKIPIDYLKIDGAFVKGIAESAHDLAMVKSINEMAHLMGKQTIAEYVENAAIQEKLLEIGIDYLQGYHIEKPIPLDTLRLA
jgi:diguanylate cyclase (GGDEF)-like protein